MKTSNGLMVVVALNDASKVMSEHAREVRLRALDALVRSARDASQALAGFREVSLQMRRWSDDLSTQLTRLRKLSAESVTQESSYRTLRRRGRLLAEAALQSGNAELKQRLELYRQRERAAQQERNKRLAATAQELDDLRQLGLMAIVLSRTAMIEASSANPRDRAVLSSVALEFGNHADAVLQLGKTLLPMAVSARQEAA
ncbi:MAG: hypothetical protein ACOZQL_07890 [Myxococcota bacterium]